MKFSTRAEYGLNAIINLASRYPEKRSISDISQEEKISLKYLEHLMGELRKYGIVKSTKGKNGGYALSKNPKLIKAGEVIEILEGSLAPMKNSCQLCSHIKNCSSSSVWITLGKEIRKTLYGIKLSDLIKN